MERILASDAAVRVLSLLVAVVLWLYVDLQRVPATTQAVRDVPVEPVNLRPGLAVVALEPPVVTAVVRTREGPAGGPGPEGWIRATVDLRGAGPGRAVLRVHPVAPEGVEVLRVTPAQVTVVLDRLAERQVPVEVDRVGRPAPGVRLEPVEVVPDRVTVRGGARLLAAVRRAVAVVDVEGLARPLRRELPVYAADASGQPVLGVELIPDRVQVILPVAAPGPVRAVPIRAVLVGEPAAGVRVARVEVFPPYAVVRVAAGAAGGPAAVPTEAVPLAGVRRTFSTEVPLRPPAGVELVGPRTVRVTVVVTGS